MTGTDTSRCPMPGCTSALRDLVPDISYHLFSVTEKHIGQTNNWIKVVRDAKNSPSWNPCSALQTICCRHFDPSCFVPFVKRRALHRWAIPTRYLTGNTESDSNQPLDKIPEDGYSIPITYTSLLGYKYKNNVSGTVAEVEHFPHNPSSQSCSNAGLNGTVVTPALELLIPSMKVEVKMEEEDTEVIDPYHEETIRLDDKEAETSCLTCPNCNYKFRQETQGEKSELEKKNDALIRKVHQRDEALRRTREELQELKETMHKNARKTGNRSKKKELKRKSEEIQNLKKSGER